MTSAIPAPLRRVLLAQSIAGSHSGARQLALQLARRHRAELLQLIIEDLELLRAANLPVAIEVLRSTGEHRSLRSHDLEAAARTQAEELLKELGQHQDLRGTVMRIHGHFPAAGIAR